MSPGRTVTDVSGLYTGADGRYRRFSATTWTVDNGMITPTLKLKRRRIMEAFADSVERMYEGH